MIPVAQFDPDAVIPLVAVCLVFGMPIIAMLLHHQRKMTEAIRGQVQGSSDVSQLQNQIHQLSHLVHQNTIAIDDLRQKLSLPEAQSQVQSVDQRLNT